MLLGAMNHPLVDLEEEIEWIADHGFDFIDLTLEPERATPDSLDATAVKRRLRETGLTAVGHTAYYLPFTSPIPELREAALNYLRRCFDFFAAVGVKAVNVHPYTRIPLYGRDWIEQRHLELLARLLTMARERGLTLMFENTSPYFNTPTDLKPLFRALPELGFHLDVGHANLGTPANLTGRLLAEFGDRLLHVHLNDNLGGEEDLHLPIGAGRINWPWVAKMLRRYGYDGTMTLEVFSPDRDYLLLSREKWRKIWEEARY
ncbi:MAG: sugar phosphate isomerase/epimerase [Firmicutes bacterium]|nr:sugar phosphate isomerase/epimerase [Bacillota bacterium]